MKKSLIAVLVIAALGIAVFTVSNRGMKTSADHVFEDAAQVSVLVNIGDGERTCWSGSGVLIGHGQYVLTASHVVTGGEKSPKFFPSLDQDLLCTQIQIGIANSSRNKPARWVEASSVESRGTVDLALLKLHDIQKDELPSAVINSAELKLGASLWLVGYPLYNSGAVSVANGIITGFPNSAYGFQYGISSDVGCGDDGAPVFNAIGEVVAIASLMPPDNGFCSTIDRSYRYNWSKDFISWARPIKFAEPLIELVEAK